MTPTDKHRSYVLDMLYPADAQQAEEARARLKAALAATPDLGDSREVVAESIEEDQA